MEKCPLCGANLVLEKEEISSVTGKVVGGSGSFYPEGSISSPPPKITRQYWVCPNPECPYRKEA